MSLNVVEICAGAGGQSLGLHLAGFQHQLAVELDGGAANTLQHNLETRTGSAPEVRIGDVADPSVWEPREFEGVDLLAGGVPCPPFSVAGKQLGSADERDLFAWSVELVKAVKPKALLLENVRGLSMPRFSGYRQAVADRLGQLGYWSEWRLLHASNHGVPQLRPRFVLVAMSEEDARYFAWPAERPTDRTVGSELAQMMGEDGWKYADEWSSAASGIAPTVVGGSKRHGGADLGPTRAKQAWAALHVDGMGIADRPPSRDAPSFQLRKPRLTNDMVARIQGWGTPGFEWEFIGRKTSVYRQIGNAFPPPVAEAVGNALADALKRRSLSGDSPSDVNHDELYRLLRRASSPISETEILSLLGTTVTGDLQRRLDQLALDFDLEVTGPVNDRFVRLGKFKAFRGESDHIRHEAFSDTQRRRRVS